MFNITFRENLPEDGDNIWPKHVATYAVYNTIIHISVYTLAGLISHNLNGVQREAKSNSCVSTPTFPKLSANRHVCVSNAR